MFRTQVGHQTTIGKKTCVDKSKSRFSLVIFASIGSSGFEFTSLLHTYYSVEIAKMKIQGLQGCTFIDKVNGGERNEEKEFLQISSNVDRYVRVSNSEMNRALFPQHSSCLQCLQRNTRRTFLVHWQSQHQNRQREFPWHRYNNHFHYFHFITFRLPPLTNIFAFLVVWNPWIEKAKTMSDFGDDEVKTTCLTCFYVLKFYLKIFRTFSRLEWRCFLASSDKDHYYLSLFSTKTWCVLSLVMSQLHSHYNQMKHSRPSRYWPVAVRQHFLQI